MQNNTIYTDDDYDLYCQFCEENVPSLEWKNHRKSEQHVKIWASCIVARTIESLFCKDCPFVANNTWCRLAEVGEEDLRLGKEFLSYEKEPMRSLICIRDELGR